MYYRNRTACILSAFVTILSTPALAQDAKPESDSDSKPAEVFKLDPVHSSVTFKIKHMGVGYTHGRFNKIAGEFAFNDADPENAGHFNFTVEADSIDTNSQGRDDHLRKPEFFNVDKHPTIRFKSTKATKTGKHTYEVTGRLQLLGKDRPLTVTLTRIGAGKDPWGGYRTGFETSFTIQRSLFGMTEMVGPIGDDVHLTVAVEGVQKAAQDPPDAKTKGDAKESQAGNESAANPSTSE